MLNKAKREYGPSGLYSKGTGKNACRYLASNQKRCHTEQSEAGAQPFRPVLQGDRQECLSLPDAVAVCTFTRNALEGGEWGQNRYFLRNKANKSFRINNYSSKEVKKATKKGNETPKRRVIQWLLERFAGRFK